MADGSQRGFHFPHRTATSRLRPGEIAVDLFAGGTPLTISRAVRMVGNSVSPPPLRAIAEANLDARITEQAAA